VTDAARLLHVRSELGYTDRPSRALPLEPEAVSSAEQRRLTDDSKRRATQREQDAYRRFIGVVVPELRELAVALDRSFSSDIRLLSRQVERIGRKLVA
jgi:hypothetical protein